MAATNTEIYRRFHGTLRPAALRAWPLAAASIRTATRRKLPIVILFAPPAIGTVIFSFVVYARFSLEAGVAPDALGGGANPAMMMMAGMAEKLIQVRQQIVAFHLAMTMFTFLIIAWYGAGLIAEDRRLGAHLLYFARPLTRRDYLVGKFLALAFFGVLAVVVPPLVICTVATFSSPEWSFLKQEGGLIPATIAYGLGWVLVSSSAVLAISSLSSRKSFALVACFVFYLLPLPISRLLVHLEREPRFNLLSLQGNFLKVATDVFDMPKLGMRYDASLSYAALGALLAVAWIVLVLRVRRMEAVA